MARRRRFRRPAPARAQRAEPVDAGAEHRRGADRRDVSHVDHQVADADGLPGHSAAHAREDRRPDRGVRSGPSLADGGAGYRRGRDPQRGRRRLVRLGAAAGGLSTPGQDGAVPGPLRRAPQGHVGPARRAARGGRALRRSATAHRRPRRRGPITQPGRRTGGSTCAFWVRSTTPGRRRRCAAPTCTARPTSGARASASSWSRRWPPAPPVVASDLDAFRRVLRDGEVGRLVPVGDGAALGGRAWSRCWRTMCCGNGTWRPARRRSSRYDWSVVASQIMRVYETVAGSGAKVQVAS